MHNTPNYVLRYSNFQAEQALNLEGHGVDPWDYYDYDDQNSESKELVTQKAISNRNQIHENQNFKPRKIFNFQAHLPHPPQVKHRHTYTSQVHHRVLRVPSKSQKKTKKKMTLKMNPDLVKLKGIRVDQSYDLTKLGFPTEWRANSSIVRDRWVVVALHM